MWNTQGSLLLLLESLAQAPYEPLEKAQFSQLAQKTAFRTLRATGCRRSELHAADKRRVQTGQIGNGAHSSLHPTLSKIPARAPDADRGRHWQVRALPEDSPHKDKLNCPVKALKLYIKASDNRRRKNHHLLFQ